MGRRNPARNPRAVNDERPVLGSVDDKKFPPMFPRPGVRKLYEDERVVMWDELLTTGPAIWHKHTRDQLSIHLVHGLQQYWWPDRPFQQQRNDEPDMKPLPHVSPLTKAGLLHAERSAGAAALVVTSVLVIGVLGNGLFGAGIRAVMDREAGVLRRFKVTPITPLPLLVASLVTGWLLYLPNMFVMIALAHVLWNMPLPSQPGSLWTG
jgi:hypothetical protein